MALERVENIDTINNKYDLAVFNKKNELIFQFYKLKIFYSNNKKILQSKNSLTIDEKLLKEKKLTNISIL